MSKLSKLTIKQAKQGLSNKDFSAVELVQDYITNIENNRKINAYITECFDSALECAKISDQNIAKSNNRELEGIPLGIKDLFCTKGVTTTASSKILSDFVPNYESTVTQNCDDAGLISLGKLNCDEFAMGSSNETSFFGNVINPVGDQLVPGGSSGGSSSALAADFTPATIGTDTGGSIRQPASFTGTVGLKPTYGLCSRWGIVAFASSLDQAGPMTKTVFDCAIMLEAMAGFDEKDSTSIKKDKEHYSKNLKDNVKGLKIGIPKEYRVDNMPKEIDELWEKGKKILKDLGAQIGRAHV